MTDTIRSRFHSRGTLYWAMMSVPDPAMPTILGSSGVDFVVLDDEPKSLPVGDGNSLDVGSVEPEKAQAAIDAVKRTPAAAFVRTASDDAGEIRRYVEAGVGGVVVPHVDTPEQAAAVIRTAREANPDVTVLPLIESRLAVANVADIVSLDGLDGVFVGPGDLSKDFGRPGQLDDPEIAGALDTVVSAALAAGVRVGIPGEPRNPAAWDMWLMLCLYDAIALNSAIADGVERARAASARAAG